MTPDLGEIVVDSETPVDERDRAVVINEPPVPCSEWDAYREDGGNVTVAEDNPDYDTDTDVVVVSYLDDLERWVDEWDGSLPITLTEAPKYYAFPPSRLRPVGETFADTRDARDTKTVSGETAEDAPRPTTDGETRDESERLDPGVTDNTSEEAHADTDQRGLDEYPALADVRERLEERSPVEVETDDGEPTLVVEKLGVRHRIRPDGTISDGPLTARLRDVVDEYLGGEGE